MPRAIEVSSALAATLADPQDRWRLEAACRGVDTDLFFPLGERVPAAQVRQAQEVCRRCPVVSACLTWALNTGVEFGIFGGCTADQRRELRAASIAAMRTLDRGAALSA